VWHTIHRFAAPAPRQGGGEGLQRRVPQAAAAPAGGILFALIAIFHIARRPFPLLSRGDPLPPPPWMQAAHASPPIFDSLRHVVSRSVVPSLF